MLTFKYLALSLATMTSFTGAGLLRPAATAPALTPALILSIYDTPELDAWIEKLVLQESGGKENIKIVDKNGYHSYGCLQFQKGTFIAYGTRYGLITEDDDINTLIYDCELQKLLAKLMIQDNYGNWRHWYTSSMTKKVGKPPKPVVPVMRDDSASLTVG
ncbi:MAG: hypothetical protein Q7S28_00460 [bacterium]|nr:hypothetical protein [bacterium]